MNRRELLNMRRSLVNLTKKIDDSLNENGEGILFKNLTQKEKVDYLLDGVCEFWGMERKELFQRNPTVLKRRRYAIMLLFEYTDLTQQEMSVELKYGRSSIPAALRVMQEYLGDTAWSDGRVKNIYYSLTEFLGLPQSKFIMPRR